MRTFFITAGSRFKMMIMEWYSIRGVMVGMDCSCKHTFIPVLYLQRNIGYKNIAYADSRYIGSTILNYSNSICDHVMYTLEMHRHQQTLFVLHILLCPTSHKQDIDITTSPLPGLQWKSPSLGGYLEALEAGPSASVRHFRPWSDRSLLAALLSLPQLLVVLPLLL